MYYTSQEDAELWAAEVVHLYRRWLASLRSRSHKLDDIDGTKLSQSIEKDVSKVYKVCFLEEWASFAFMASFNFSKVICHILIFLLQAKKI